VIRNGAAVYGGGSWHGDGRRCAGQGSEHEWSKLQVQKLMQSLAVRLEADYDRENGLEGGNTARKLVVLQLARHLRSGSLCNPDPNPGVTLIKAQSGERCVHGSFLSWAALLVADSAHS
jgi:hypothetical protein